MNWKDLQKGDKLYLLVPIKRNNFLSYDYQESHIINCNIHDDNFIFKFKYTDGYGKRKRKTVIVYSHKLNTDTTFCNLDTSRSYYDFEYLGNTIFITYKSKDVIKNLYKDIISTKLTELETLKNYYTVLLETI